MDENQNDSIDLETMQKCVLCDLGNIWFFYPWPNIGNDAEGRNYFSLLRVILNFDPWSTNWIIEITEVIMDEKINVAHTLMKHILV